jgi:subtilisin
MKRLLLIALLVVAVVPAATSSQASDGAGRYIVVLSDAVADPGAVAASLAQAYGVQVGHVYRSAIKGYSAIVPAGRVAALRADPRVRFVTLDGDVQAFDQTVGTGVSRIKAVGKANKGAGVNVAVIDTGIDTTHPDLAANIAGWTNCSDKGPRNYGDSNGHGTHVAGIIAALDNGIGVVGVAPGAKLWSVRVLDATGSGSFSDVVCGIDFVDGKSPAKGGPITVANMSLGGPGSDDGNCGNSNGDPVHLAVCQVVRDGVTLVVAAGNSKTDLSNFIPAAYDEAVTVSALYDSDGQPCGLGSAIFGVPDDDFAWFSNYAASADSGHVVAAPGVFIYSTYKGGVYATLSGTSMASPHVAGAAALYVAAHPGASPASVRDALVALGEPPNTSFNGECGGPTGHGKNQIQHVSHTDVLSRHPEVEIRADGL